MPSLHVPPREANLAVWIWKDAREQMTRLQRDRRALGRTYINYEDLSNAIAARGSTISHSSSLDPFLSKSHQRSSKQILDVHRHFLDVDMVITLDVFHCPHVVIGYEINHHWRVASVFRLGSPPRALKIGLHR